jgi:transcriptional regulator with XRE-family HTH domain
MGSMIRQARLEAGFRQSELARLVGASKQAACEWEHERSFPKRDTLIRLASVLGVTTDRLMGVEDAHDEPAQESVQGNT